MKFRYIDRDGPEETQFRGVDFVRGEWVEVYDPAIIAKLSNLAGFESYNTIEGECEVVIEADALPAPEIVAEAPKRRGRPPRVAG